MSQSCGSQSLLDDELSAQSSIAARVATFLIDCRCCQQQQPQERSHIDDASDQCRCRCIASGSIWNRIGVQGVGSPACRQAILINSTDNNCSPYYGMDHLYLNLILQKFVEIYEAMSKSIGHSYRTVSITSMTLNVSMFPYDDRLTAQLPIPSASFKLLSLQS